MDAASLFINFLFIASLSEFPNQVERKKILEVSRITTLKTTGQGSAPYVERRLATIEEFICGPDRNLFVHLVLDTSAISQLAIQRQRGRPIRFGDG